MALFQTSVLKTYLAQQDSNIVERAYKKYTKYFHNLTIQENIKNSKEEQYQAKFLDELFVSVYDYNLNRTKLESKITKSLVFFRKLTKLH